MAFGLPQIVLVPLREARINRLIERRVVLLRRFGDKLADLPGTDHDVRHSDMPGVLDSVFDNRLRIHLWKFGQKALMNLLSAIATLSVVLVGGLMVVGGDRKRVV